MTNIEESAPMTGARTLSVWRVILASVLGFGLLYVDRWKWALVSLIAPWLIIGALSWSRLIVQPSGLYVAEAALLASLFLHWVYPLLVLIRCRSTGTLTAIMLNRRYTNGWVYGSFAVLALVVTNVVTLHRADWLGYETFRIPSSSMSPTLDPGDFVQIDSWIYRTAPPANGDIIVYTSHAPSGAGPFVKRIVAGPGDTVELRDGALWRNGKPISEPYLHDPALDPTVTRDLAPLTMPADAYFVLGDYRDNSLDSRTIGPVMNSDIRGKVVLRWFSFSEGKINFSRIGEILSGGQ